MLAASGVALVVYVAAPCGSWWAVARNPAARARAAARAAFAAQLSARCDRLGTRAALPALTCSAGTEAEALPLVPRACLGRAHHTLRLHVAGGPAPPPDGRPNAAAARATFGHIAAALTAAFPEDAGLVPVAPAAAPARGGTAPTDPDFEGLRALGFRDVEVLHDDRLLGRFVLGRAPGDRMTGRQVIGGGGR